MDLPPLCRVLVRSEAFVESVVMAGAERQRILYYPNWAESFYRQLSAPEIALQTEDLPKGFRVMFAGNLAEAQSLYTIVEAANILKVEVAIHWITVGDGRRAEWMKREVKKLGLGDRVSLIGLYSAEEIPSLLAVSDVLLATLKADNVFTQTVPSKIQSYMACGKPVLAALNGEGARVIREASAGVVEAAGDGRKLAEAVQALYRTPEAKRKTMSECGRSYYEAHFERDMLMSRLEQWMQKTCEEGIAVS